MENDEREKSFIIPCIYTLFFLCVAIGGVLLIFYVFFPTLSQPWQAIAGLALIGSTWLFWLLTYVYSCIKLCFRRDAAFPVTTRQTTRNASVSASSSTMQNRQQGGKQDSALASSGNSETPLAYAA